MVEPHKMWIQPLHKQWTWCCRLRNSYSTICPKQIFQKCLLKIEEITVSSNVELFGAIERRIFRYVALLYLLPFWTLNQYTIFRLNQKHSYFEDIFEFFPQNLTISAKRLFKAYVSKQINKQSIPCNHFTHRIKWFNCPFVYILKNPKLNRELNNRIIDDSDQFIKMSTNRFTNQTHTHTHKRTYHFALPHTV